MNLKLAKRIRQGMREMAQVRTGGAIKGSYPDDYEGEIPRKGAYHWPSIFHHDYLHSQLGELWATKKTDDSGTETLQPSRIIIRLKLISPRQIYKRAKRMVA